jgi:hypothetical protein
LPYPKKYGSRNYYGVFARRITPEIFVKRRRKN